MTRVEKEIGTGRNASVGDGRRLSCFAVLMLSRNNMPPSSR